MSIDETDSVRLAHEGLTGMPGILFVVRAAAWLTTLRTVTLGRQFHPLGL